MILPHPRYYTDCTNTVPLAIGGFIESDMWPRVFFVVFKSPHEGQHYVFRKGEPYCKLIFLPKHVEYRLDHMTPSEESARANQEIAISNFRKDLATRCWKTVNGEEFDNKYKQLSAAHRKEGSIQETINSVKTQKQEEEKAKVIKKFPRKVIKRHDT